MSDSVRPHRRKPIRLPRPWDSLGKNTGVGRHFLLQCVKGKNESEVTQSCPTLSDPMDCSLPGSAIHGVFQARVLKWGAIPSDKTELPLLNQKWNHKLFQFSSVQFSRSVMSGSLQPHESQHARPPCPSPTPGVHSNSYPLSR